MAFKNKPNQLSVATLTVGEKRICVGQRVFIVGNKHYFERKKMLCSKYFKHNQEQTNEIIHLSYNNHFLVKKKRLSVSAEYYTTHGPYGDRIKVQASYNGICIGDYGLLRSSIGVGTHGSWPIIKNEEWQIIIKLNLEKNEKGYMHFYVEYFEKISPVLFFLKSKVLI